jgi:signal transduction histidine kinase
MRERATELGGSFVVEPLHEGGTLVCARLPLPEKE